MKVSQAEKQVICDRLLSAVAGFWLTARWCLVEVIVHLFNTVASSTLHTGVLHNVNLGRLRESLRSLALKVFNQRALVSQREIPVSW